MRHALGAIELAMVLASGSALAQETKSSPGRTSLGVQAGSLPTPNDCARGWTPRSRWSWTDFHLTCRKL
jgi:hypothetical protein